MFTEKLLHHGGMVMDNKSIDIGGGIMNILKDLVNRVNEKVMIKTVLGEVVTMEELGGARVHSEISGNAHFFAHSEYECFEQIVKNRKKVRVEPIIDGYSRFLILDKKDMPEVALHWEKHFQWALGKYNRTHEEQMPKITPHVCRHTYCSNMAKAGMNPKALQYLMGHSDIGVTLNVYTHLGLIDAKEEMNRIAKLA